jgi:hypothetical protein
MKFCNVPYILFALLLTFAASCTKRSSIEDNSILPPPEPEIDESYELSYWIDIDVRHNNGRGYWFNVDAKPEDVVPTEAEVSNSCRGIAEEYNGRKLYVTYHRQFEIDKAKNVFLLWKQYGSQYGIDIVPTFVLESYATPTRLNFTNNELTELAAWCKQNINSNELGIYDVYVRQSVGSAQDLQLTELSAQVQIALVRVGVQPGERMNSYFFAGVQDTWSAECQGLTNELWENARYYKGSNKYGRRLLQEWVNERLNGDTRKITWNLIPVAWDYDDPLDPFGYIFPGDNALTNDPPVPGRLHLSQQYIISWYPRGTANRLFGGFSCDLHILEANSYGRPESPTFYEQLRSGQPYQGYFANAMKEVAEVYENLMP